MLDFFLVFYIIIAVFLIIFILLDRGKGSEVGALSTGSEFLTPKSSSSFFNRLIISFIILFLVVNICITFISKNTFVKTKPIVELSDSNK